MTKKKNTFLLWVLFSSFILLAGCETAKGAAYGVGATAQGVGEGIGATAEGVAKDTTNLWQAMLRADEWMRKNLW